MSPFCQLGVGGSVTCLIGAGDAFTVPQPSHLVPLEDCGHTTLEKMKLITALFKHGSAGNSLVVQWLRLGAFTAMPVDSVPGQGTKIPQPR